MTDRHAVTRVRHEIHRRLLTVKRTERITPHMIRIALAGDDLTGFVSAGYDDHVKLFFGVGGQAPVIPELGRGAPVVAEGVTPPVMRDFTPRRYDPAAGELIIDFAVHEAGPATEWAVAAKSGDKLGVAGPKGSFVVTDDFDWYLLVGDETALPAIGRRVEELRAGAKVIVVAAVTGSEEQQAFDSRADVEAHWVHRPLSQASNAAWLVEAVAGLTLPLGDGYAWVAGESGTAKALREHLVGERGLNKAWVKAAGYWRSGGAGIHDHFDD